MSFKIAAFLTFNSVLLHLTSASSNLDISRSIYMSNANHCNLYSGTDAENGIITSHPELYDDVSAECYVVIDAGSYADDALVLLRGDSDIKLSNTGTYPACDQLFIYDGNYTSKPSNTAIIRNYSCATTTAASANYHESTGHALTIHFKPNDDDITRYGFRFHYSVFRSAISCDNDKEFQCDTNRCIPAFHLCDNIKHCVDGSDETMSACLLYFYTITGLVWNIFMWIRLCVVLYLSGLSIYWWYQPMTKKTVQPPDHYKGGQHDPRDDVGKDGNCPDNDLSGEDGIDDNDRRQTPTVLDAISNDDNFKTISQPRRRRSRGDKTSCGHVECMSSPTCIAENDVRVEFLQLVLQMVATQAANQDTRNSDSDIKYGLDESKKDL